MSPETQRRDNGHVASPRTRELAVLVGFVVLAVAPFAYVAATRSWFWQHQYRPAPVATALFVLLVGALVFGRFRWAWWMLVAFYIAVIVGGIVDLPHYALGLASNLAVLGFLLSAPMRRRVRRPVQLALPRDPLSQA